MADVFVSYARPDEAHAARIADALRAEGFSVWRDDELPAHRAYADVIQERLNASKAVVVLWSTDAAQSQWVRAEADSARNAGTLVQVTLDGSLPPLPFNQIQCAELKGWGGTGSNGWRKLISSVTALVGSEVQDRETSKPVNRKPSICVLPLQNMSGDAEQEYFSDGISEDITTDLSKVSALDVIARNTAFTFKGQSLDVCEVARKLGVSHVLEGSVRKAGSRVRISAQLIDGKAGSHVWAERYDRELTDIFAIQDEISKAIVEALKLKLLPEEKRAIEARGTSNAEAYNLYLMARQFWINGNYGDARRDRIVVRTTERAIEIDPNYAKAWALKAIAQASLCYHHGLVGDDGLAAAEKALALDPTVTEAYAVRARHLAEHGDFVRAEGEIAAGLHLEPDCWDLVREAARIAMVQRKLNDAERHFIHATQLDDSDFHSPMMLTTCYHAMGDQEGAESAARTMLERAERAIAQDPLNASAIGVAAGALVMLGRIDDAMEKHERAMLIDPDNISMPYNFACALTVFLDEYDAAMDLIEPLLVRVSPTLLLTALTDPDMDKLRENPRFIKAIREAIARTGLAPEKLPEWARPLAI